MSCNEYWICNERQSKREPPNGKVWKQKNILLIEIKYKTLSSKIVWYVKPVFCILFSSVCWLLVGISSACCTLRLSHKPCFVSSFLLFFWKCLLLSDVGCFNRRPCFVEPIPTCKEHTHTIRNITNHSKLYESIDRLKIWAYFRVMLKATWQMRF